MKKVIDEVYESLKTIPSSLKNNEKYVSENKIRDCIKKIYKQNNLYNDYYHKCHENRFILTLSEIPKCKNKNENILEIGSFTYFSMFLKEILGYENIYGLDKISNTKEKILKTTKKVGEKEYSQTIFNIDLDSEEDYETIIKSGIKFDKIIFMEVLEHLYRPTLPLIKFREILKEDGVLILTTPNSCSLTSLYNLFNMKIPFTFSTMCYETPYSMHVREYTPITLKYMLLSCGYSEKSFNTINAYNLEVKKEFYKLYPFKNKPELNKKLINDTMISISTPNRNVISKTPDILYQTAIYERADIGAYMQTLDKYFNVKSLKDKNFFNFIKFIYLYFKTLRY